MEQRVKALSTEKLNKLDLNWKNKIENSFHQELHSMVQMILIERGEQTLEMKRQEQIKELNRSFRLSNPFGRVVSGFKSVFTTRTKSWVKQTKTRRYRDNSR